MLGKKNIITVNIKEKKKKKKMNNLNFQLTPHVPVYQSVIPASQEMNLHMRTGEISECHPG